MGSLEKQSINFCLRSNVCCATAHKTPAATSPQQLLRDCVQCQSFELNLTDIILHPLSVHQTSPHISQSAGREDAPLTFVIQSREMNSDIPLAGRCVGLGYLTARPSNIYLYKVNF